MCPKHASRGDKITDMRYDCACICGLAKIPNQAACPLFGILRGVGWPGVARIAEQIYFVSNQGNLSLTLRRRRGVAQLVRALVSKTKGRGFESPRPCQTR